MIRIRSSVGAVCEGLECCRMLYPVPADANVIHVKTQYGAVGNGIADN